MRRSPQSGGVLGFLLVSIMVIVLAVVGMFFAGWYLAENVRIDKAATHRGETVRVETPIGSMKIEQRSGLDPKHLGVPIYPRAVREDSDENRLASFEIDFGSSYKEFTVVAAEYSTSDPVEKVIEFYRTELPHWIVIETRRHGPRMEYTEDGYKRIIAIREKHGRTWIGLASVGEPAAN